VVSRGARSTNISLRAGSHDTFAAGESVAAIDFLSRGITNYPLSELIGTKFELERLDEAFQEALTGRSLRVAVCP
jgi:Zn-dependent alcohol dehydrogenase